MLNGIFPLLIAMPAFGQENTLTTISEPIGDRWMYNANGTPGSRSQASTFSALPI